MTLLKLIIDKIFRWPTAIVIWAGIFIYAIFFSTTEDDFKEYIISHELLIEPVPTTDWLHLNTHIDVLGKNAYFAEITMHIDDDSSYTVVAWGDRNALIWKWKKDFKFTVDIPYKRYKGEDVTKDIEMLNVLNRTTQEFLMETRQTSQYSRY